MKDLIKREDVVFLITHQRNALLEAAEKEASHHADVLRDMAKWWGDLTEAVKKLAAQRIQTEAPAKDLLEVLAWLEEEEAAMKNIAVVTGDKRAARAAKNIPLTAKLLRALAVSPPREKT